MLDFQLELGLVLFNVNNIIINIGTVTMVRPLGRVRFSSNSKSLLNVIHAYA